MASITRADVASLIAEEYASTVIQAATQGSTVLAAFDTVNMGTKVTNMPVLASLPEAAWVSDTDNTARKPTSKATWANRTLVAEEVAVIVPVHENTLDDVTADILGDLAKVGGQAIGKKLDQAVLFGTDKPTSWTSPDLLAAATAAGNVVTQTAAAGAADAYGAALQVAGMIADAGFDPTVLLAKRSLSYLLANLRTTAGAMVLQNDQMLGFETHWSRNGAWEPDEAVSILVDPTTVRIGVRQDITTKFLDQATIGTGENQINLAEQDMVALRFKARFAYVLGNPVTPETGVQSYGVGAVAPQVP